jgi:CheY-like chemotaxis protein
VPNGRRGTRISCKISLTIAGLDADHPFSEPCTAILVNPQGCAARFGRSLEVGAAVRLEGVPASRNVTARVVNCISPGKYEKFWLLGLALDEPGNVWGIETPPEDWDNDSTTLAPSSEMATNLPGATIDSLSKKLPPPVRPLILCLEDNESYLRLRKAVLEKEGYNVIAASTAKDALSTLREAPVCLVLADHMLRGTTGTSLAAQMKRIKPDVPVVLYSGLQPERLTNVDLFINKNVSTHDFLGLVRQVMKRYSS